MKFNFKNLFVFFLISNVFIINLQGQIIGPILGSSILCSGNNYTLTDTTLGGNWYSSNTTIATIDSNFGIISGLNTGIDTITYWLSDSFFTTTIITVNPLPTVNNIYGTDSVCEGFFTTLLDSTIGGIYSTTNANAIVLAGIVTGITAGTDTIYYTYTNSCGSASTYVVVTINPLPNSGIITGLDSICLGSNVTLTDTANGGIWSANNTHAFVVAGVVSAMSSGIDTINYTVTNSCGSTSSISIISINSIPDIAPISGIDSVCVGSIITLSDTFSGGGWNISNTNASIMGGIFTGLSSGTDTVFYSLNNSCGSVSTSVVITINPLPIAGIISGTATVCVGSSITFTDTIIGGIWNVSNANATIVSGITSGNNAGIDSVIYTVTNNCGIASTNKVLTINIVPNAGTILGLDTTCQGGVFTYTDTILGGIWTVSNANAMIAFGVVSCIFPGTDTLIYTVTNSCGTMATYMPIYINPLPAAGIITGIDSLCVGANTTLSDTVIGGIWNATNNNVSVVEGVVLGVYQGLDTIQYYLSNGCGSSTTSIVITVNTLPGFLVISGSDFVCIGATTTLSSATVGGIWSVTNANANVVSGIITGISLGADTVLYSAYNSCGSVTVNTTITIDSLPVVASITGINTVCQGSSISLVDTSIGGIWNISNVNATLLVMLPDSIRVTGTVAGIDTILYSLTNSCGTSSAYKIITINQLPDAGIINGSNTICLGATNTFLDTVAIGLGSWGITNANAHVVPISIGMCLITGDTIGIDTLQYITTNSCGTDTISLIITISPPLVVAAITGIDTVCQGGMITLTDTTLGGVWHVANTNASVLGGVVTGINVGTDSVFYSILSSCGLSTSSVIVTINPLPNPGTIAGITSMCIGSLVVLTDSVEGGTWNALNSNAVVGSGVVSGLSAGTDTIAYAVTNSCGISTAFTVVTVNSLPIASTIVGSANVCVGGFDTLFDAIPNGVWSAFTSGISIDTIGIVHGLIAGEDSVKYEITNSCGTASINYVIHVNPLPFIGTVTGADSVCLGSNITLSEAALGGTWTATNTNAFIVAWGVVSGNAAGIDTIIFTETNSCGTVNSKKIIEVAAPLDDSIFTSTDSICLGNTISFSDSFSGSFWTALNNHASISYDSGIYNITGLSSGVDTFRLLLVNICGSHIIQKTIHVNPIASVYPIVYSVSDSICIGSTEILTDSTIGGVWNSSNSSIVYISSSGIISALNEGIDTIFYTYTNSCGTAKTTQNIVVKQHVHPVISPDSVCSGAVISYSDSSLGTWSLLNTNALLYPSSGILLGIYAGTDSLIFTPATGCGSIYKKITIVPLPNAGVFFGHDTLCPLTPISIGSTILGGTWHISNGLITIYPSTSSCLLIPNAVGLDTITYSKTNYCGTATITEQLLVMPFLTAGTITGPDSFCAGSSVTLSLTGASPGGGWNNFGLSASVASGVVTGVTGGADIISYNVYNYCSNTYSTHPITVIPLPEAGTIEGSHTVCFGSTDTLTDTSTIGYWGATNANATLTSGIATAMAVGIDTITFSSVTTCGTQITSFVITINPLPNAGNILGPDSVCAGSSITWAVANSGGFWNVTNSSQAYISPLFLGCSITGVNQGLDTMIYKLINSCGIDSIIKPFVINPLPNVGTITGNDSVCVGVVDTFIATIPGGFWSCANSNAIVSGGLVTGLKKGIDTVYYTITNICGLGVTSQNFYVRGTPDSVRISGLNYVCPGRNKDTLIGTPSGGVWNITNTRAGFMGNILSGNNEGLDTIIYTVANICGITNDSLVVTIPSAWYCDSINEVQYVQNTNDLIKIYPNPASTLVTVELINHVKDVYAILYNLMGQTLEIKNFEENSDVINIETGNLPEGTYFIVVNMGNKRFKEKIVLLGGK